MPVAAIAVQAVIANAYVAAVGTGQGREIIDDTLGLVGLGGLPWKDFFGGFEPCWRQPLRRSGRFSC